MTARGEYMKSMKGKAVLKELNADEDCDTENKEAGIDEYLLSQT